jgi:hypothetical protein
VVIYELLDGKSWTPPPPPPEFSICSQILMPIIP